MVFGLQWQQHPPSNNEIFILGLNIAWEKNRLQNRNARETLDRVVTLPREKHPPDNPLKDLRKDHEWLCSCWSFARTSLFWEKLYGPEKMNGCCWKFPRDHLCFRDRLALPPSRPWDKQDGFSLWDHLQHPIQLRPEGRDKLWPGWVGWSFPGSYKNNARSREKSHLHKLLTNPCHKCPGSEIHFTLKYQ